MRIKMQLTLWSSIDWKNGRIGGIGRISKIDKLEAGIRIYRVENFLKITMGTSMRDRIKQK